MQGTFGYWWVRGCAQPIRFLLAYLKIEQNSKIYSNFDDWFAHDKPNLGLDLPNIPHWIDKDVKLTESAAFPVYLIKKSDRHDLLGQNRDGSFNYKEVQVQQLLGYFRDVNREFTQNICPNKDFETIKEKLLNEKMQNMLDKIVKILGNQQYILGDLTYADFAFYEILNYYKQIYPQTINKQLQDYINNFESLSGIKEYLVLPDINLKQFLPSQFYTWSGPH
ncbi:hypothetical protein ABPG72_013475 [Tetrahymena utriculariae]